MPTQTPDTSRHENTPNPNEERPSPSSEPQERPESEDKKSSTDDHGGRKHFFLTVGIATAILIVLFFIGIVPRLRAKPALKKEARDEAQALPQVAVDRPVRAPRETTLTLPANIQPVQETDISARASGFVQQWRVDIGDKVRRGQILAVIDTPDVDQQVQQANAQLSQAQAQLLQQRAEAARAMANLAQSRQNAERQRQQLVQAQSDLNLARVTADRWRYLVKEGAVSQQSADQQIAAYENNRANVAALTAAVGASQSDIVAYQAALASAEANVVAAQANVRASQANLRRNGVLKAFKVVRAPFSGVVTSRSIDAGSLLGGGAEPGGDGSSGNGGGGASPASGGQGTTSGSGSNSARSSMYGARPDAGVNTGETNAAQSVARSSGQTAPPSDPGSSMTQGVSALPGTAAASGEAATTAAAGAAARSQIGGPAGTGGADSGGSAATPQASFGSGTDQGIGGTVVSPGTSLYHIARIDVMRVQVNVPQSFVPYVHVGGRTKVTVSEFPDVAFLGKIARTASALDPQTRTLLTEILISNPDRKLLPGMFAQIVFRVPRPVAPLLVSSSALISSDKGTQLGTVDARSGEVHYVNVTVGRDYGRQIEILSGIEEGDLILQDPSDDAREGAKVKPVLPKQSEGQGQSGGTRGQGGAQSQSKSQSDLGATYGGSLDPGARNAASEGDRRPR